MKKILYSALTLILGLVLSSSGCTHDTIDPALFDEGVEINGVTWATRNVAEFGKFAATPEDPGMFYQWNRKTAYSATGAGAPANWDATMPSSTWDAANDPCPKGWQVPTQSQMTALIAADLGWDATGRKFGTVSGTIFLPGVGMRMGDGTFVAFGACYYRSSSILGATNAYSLTANSTIVNIGNAEHNMGLPIRCVKGAK